MTVRIHDLFAAVVENSQSFVGIAALDGTLTYVNAAAPRFLAVPDGEPFPARTFLELFAPEDLPYATEVILTALEREHRWAGDFQFRSASSAVPITVFLTIYHLRGEDAGVPVAIAITAHDVRERRRSEARLRTLVDAGAAMNHSLDVSETLAKIAELVVRTFATACVVDIFRNDPNADEPIQRIASSHIDRVARRRLTAGLSEFKPPLDHPAHPVARVFADGSSSLVTSIDDAWISRTAVNSAHADEMLALGMSSLITVPLVASGTVLGAMTCVLGTESTPRTGVPRQYDAEDLFFAEELGRRAGAALENARLYAQQSRIAQTLQAASLPRELPAIAGMAVDAEYRPGKAEATIGGDWYDAFELADGRVVFTVGDVLGSGLAAAVTMTKLRQSMQAAAMVDPDPRVMLEVADKTLRLHDPEGYATALAAVYDPRTRVTTLASAGHAGPAVRLPDGSISEHAAGGLLLGIRNGSVRTRTELATPVGSLLVFFTDGLTEATRDIEAGHARVRAALADAGVIGADRPARAIVDDVLAGEAAHDDVAVLTARVGERRARPR